MQLLQESLNNLARIKFKQRKSQAQTHVYVFTRVWAEKACCCSLIILSEDLKIKKYSFRCFEDWRTRPKWTSVSSHSRSLVRTHNTSHLAALFPSCFCHHLLLCHSSSKASASICLSQVSYYSLTIFHLLWLNWVTCQWRYSKFPTRILIEPTWSTQSGLTRSDLIHLVSADSVWLGAQRIMKWFMCLILTQVIKSDFILWKTNRSSRCVFQTHWVSFIKL